MPFLGPVLAFHGATDDAWQLSALVVDAEDPGPLVPEGGQEIPAQPLWTVNGRTAWRYRFAAPLGRSTRYTVAGVEATVQLPGVGMSPRMAYASCNGFSDLATMKRVADKNALWRRMAALHAKTPYNLLLLGGDQVYADSMWSAVPTMKRWAELGWDQANRARFTDTMERQLEAFYFNLYVERWSRPEVAAMLASVPNICMWDDHDLIDGFGSYPPERQGCPVLQGLGGIARRAFAVFQQQVDPKGEAVAGALSPARGFSRGHVVGRLAIVALDMRSERTVDQVLGLEHWGEVFAWMDRLDRAEVDHLLVMSSIPVVYPGFDTIERVLGVVPGQQDLEDDLRDHWNSRPHKGERLRLIHRLLDIAARGIRPTLLSGDVHVGAVGVIEAARGSTAGTTADVVNQLISSGIVHPGPGGMVLFALTHLLDSADEVDRGIVARMTKFPGTSTTFIGGRNFLSLEPDDKKRIWGNWIVENDDHPYVKVIHTVDS